MSTAIRETSRPTEGEDRAVMEEEESVGTQGESLADGVGVIEVAESSNESGPEANQEERPTMLTQATRRLENRWVEEKPCSPREDGKLHKQLQPTRHMPPNMCLRLQLLLGPAHEQPRSRRWERH